MTDTSIKKKNLRSHQCRAPGKLVIVGEYAVLEGAPALSVAVDRFSYCNVSALPKLSDTAGSFGANHSDEKKTFEAPTLELECKPLMDAKQRLSLHGGWPDEIEWIRFYLSSLCEVTEGFSKYLDAKDLQIQLNTEDFYDGSSNSKLGLGGSGASLVSLALALGSLAAFSKDSSFNALESFEQIRDIQKKRGPSLAGSGVDIATALMGGWIRYEPRAQTLDKRIKKLKVHRELLWCAVWTENTASTKEQILNTFQFKEEEPYLYDQWMKALGEKSEKACNAYESRHFSDFLGALDSYQESLNSFTQQMGAPAMSRVHKRISELCKRKDIVYKPSGAGVGDMGLLFALSRNEFDEAREKLKAEGFKTFCFKTPLQGARIS